MQGDHKVSLANGEPVRLTNPMGRTWILSSMFIFGVFLHTEHFAVLKVAHADSDEFSPLT